MGPAIEYTGVMRSFLFTDLYELTMAQGYFFGTRSEHVVFNMFFRRQPFDGGFAVFAGLEDLLDTLEELRFSEDDCAYLESLGLFRAEFLEYLRDFRFQGTVDAVKEGTVVFPHEPLVQVSGKLVECQIIESLLLNTVNYQTLIATKTARIVHAAQGGAVLEFGMRRAQGPDGAMTAARAAYIGGASATSNTLAGKRYGIPVKGTMAHSWIMAFQDEYQAFRAYADLYPDASVFLIDTYETLGSGIDSAIKVGLEMKEQGQKMGVRLDSGDLDYLSHQVRRRLDAAGLEDARITVSNELNEQIIAQLVATGAPIDAWGVGTKLVTGEGDPSLTGVYKLVAVGPDAENLTPVIKVSNTPEKTTNPGAKKLYRLEDHDGHPLGDLIALASDELPEEGQMTLFHPGNEHQYYRLTADVVKRPLLQCVMKDGIRLHEREDLTSLQARCKHELELLDATYKRVINPHVYKVSLSPALKTLKFGMIDRHRGS